MPLFGPVSRRDFISAIKKLGFIGPVSGGKHQYMIRGTRRLTIPNPHSGDISTNLLNKLLKQAGISRGEWEKL